MSGIFQKIELHFPQGRNWIEYAPYRSLKRSEMDAMTDKVPFARMNGAGNEILVVDMRGQKSPITPQAAIHLASQSETKFDQIMAIHDPRNEQTDAYIMILNCDGTQAQACGNGTRCVVQAMSAETGKNAFTFQTVAGILSATEHETGLISVDMGQPIFEWDRIPLEEEFIDTSRIELQIGPIDDPILHSPSVMSMGNPHAIFWVTDDVWSYDLEKFGPLLENHPVFPEKANISLAQVTGNNELTMRTWERGAGITQACGSAACAGAVSANRTERCDRNVLIHMPGGDLSLEWKDNNHVIMTGPAEWEWSGMLDPVTGEWTRDQED
jgi:diaminopimelate epimerase